MAEVEITSGICGFATKVQANRINRRQVDVHIATECPNINKISTNVITVDPYKELFNKLHETQTYKILCEVVAHPACLVPAGVLKSIEVAAELALPRDCHLSIKKNMTKIAGYPKIKLLSCSIMKREIDFLVRKHGLDVDANYIDCSMHVFPDRLKAEVKSHMNGPGQVIVYGNKCFAGIEQVAEDGRAVLIGAGNCVEMLLGPKVSGQDQYRKAFFLTPGWFENWDKMIKKTLHWDRISARLNFGCCDRMLIIDTGLIEMPDLEILEIFDYCGLPAASYETGLEHFEGLLLSALKKAGSCSSEHCAHNNRPMPESTLL